MGGKGKGKKEKRARPSSSTGDELEEDGRHYGELLGLYKSSNVGSHSKFPGF